MQIAIYVLLGFSLLVLFLNYLSPRSFHVHRSIVIQKPSGEVFSFVKLLENQDLWSPWAERDPKMKKELRGTDGEIGAVSAWRGNNEVGEGEQEITRIVEGELVESRLRFIKPFRSESDAYIKVGKIDQGRSKVTWGFSGENGFPMRIFLLFVSMEKSIGKDFEYGLRKLKSTLENN